MPVTRARVELTASATGTTMALPPWFADREEAGAAGRHGRVEGKSLALGGVDALLAEG
jgi:hypothetical protein